MRRLLLSFAGTLGLGLVVTAPADAVWIGAAKVDGPAPIVRVGGAAIASDGTGAVAYVKKIGDRKHHDRDRAGFVARLTVGHSPSRSRSRRAPSTTSRSPPARTAGSRSPGSPRASPTGW